MSEAKFTPGPWRVPHFAQESVRCQCGYVFGQVDRMGAVATVHYSGPTHEPDMDHAPLDEAIANARLIGAAPDLYEALAKLETAASAPLRGLAVEAGDDPLLLAIFEARIALAKADGGSEQGEGA